MLASSAARRAGLLHSSRRNDLKALICVKRVVDYAVKIRVQQDKKGVEIKDLKLSINPFCEIAVEEGIRMKEKGLVDEIVSMSIG